VLEGRCALRLTRRYRAPPDEVWEALTDRASLDRWLGRTTHAGLELGGTLELELADGGRVSARIREMEPARVLELDWSADGETASVVRFEVAPDEAGTLLVLDHRRIEERFGMRYMGRWSRALARLEAGIAP
jgi:uncharacterized protein YndB with AHSA1/START domain